MRKFLTIILTTILMISCNKNSNSTDCGHFWYSDLNKESLGNTSAIWDNYVNYFMLDNKFCLHLIKYLPLDKNSYYTGLASVKNDTMYIDIKDELKFSFKTEIEMSPKLKLCNLYFTSKIIPKVIYCGDQKIIKNGPTVIEQ